MQVSIFFVYAFMVLFICMWILMLGWRRRAHRAWKALNTIHEALEKTQFNLTDIRARVQTERELHRKMIEQHKDYIKVLTKIIESNGWEVGFQMHSPD
jgi:hypothetical protein